MLDLRSNCARVGRHLAVVMLAVVVAIAFGTSSLSLADARTDALMVDLMEGMKADRLRAEHVRVDGLHASYLQTVDAGNRKITSLALGAHYLDTNPRLALQYLSSAELSCRAGDDLLPIVRFFIAKAKLRAGAAAEALAIAEDLLAAASSDGWRREYYGVLIESAYEVGAYAKLIESFKSYSEKFSFSRRQEHLARLAILALENKGEIKAANALLEELARNYPTTEESRWAMRRLSEHTCEHRADKGAGYRVSQRLLLGLARNVLLDPGIKDFVVAATSAPLVLENGAIKVLDGEERYELLFAARLYDAALVAATALYDDAAARGDEAASARFLYQMARVGIRMHQPEIAARHTAKFLASWPKHSLASKAYELLGDALKHAGLPLQASEQYDASLAIKNDGFLRWERFWNLYRGGAYQEALGLLERPGYVQPRPGDDNQSVRYWLGKILEKLGQSEQAQAKFKEILADTGDGFYANLIAIQYPELVEGVGDTKPEGGDHGRGISLAARILTPSPADPAASTRPELKLVDDLLKVGLRDAATLQLASLKMHEYSQEDAFAAVSRLAWVLDDYWATKRIRSQQTSLRALPTGWKEYVTHQMRYREDWKVYLPLAFQNFVEPVARGTDVDKFLLLSIMRAESFYNKDARSAVGAQGLMQLMPYTAVKIAELIKDREFDVRDLNQPEINIAYGGYYLSRLIEYYRGNPYVAVAAYNAGPVAVDRWLKGCAACTTDEFLETIPYRETRRYVREVMKNFAQYRRVYEGHLTLEPLPSLPRQLPQGWDVF